MSRTEAEKRMEEGGGSKRAGCGSQAGEANCLFLPPTPFFLPLCPHLHTVWSNEQGHCMHSLQNYIYNHYHTVRHAGACSCKRPHCLFVFHNTHIYTHTVWYQKSPHPRSDTSTHRQVLQTQRGWTEGMNGWMENRKIDRERVGWRVEGKEGS